MASNISSGNSPAVEVNWPVPTDSIDNEIKGSEKETVAVVDQTKEQLLFPNADNSLKQTKKTTSSKKKRTWRRDRGTVLLSSGPGTLPASSSPNSLGSVMSPSSSSSNFSSGSSSSSFSTSLLPYGSVRSDEPLDKAKYPKQDPTDSPNSSDKLKEVIKKKNDWEKVLWVAVSALAAIAATVSVLIGAGIIGVFIPIAVPITFSAASGIALLAKGVHMAWQKCQKGSRTE